nr:immunoglobulin heavy chain junction region [Mus musculus]
CARAYYGYDEGFDYW